MADHLDRDWVLSHNQRLIVPSENRISCRLHDLNLKREYDALRLEIERNHGRVVWLRGELTLKRLIERARRDYYTLAGHWPSVDQLRTIAQRYACAVGPDGKLKIPDLQVWRLKRSGYTAVENYDYVSGRGLRLRMKLAVGFRMLGTGRKRRRTVALQTGNLGRMGKRAIREYWHDL
jgi:hypothetical protein